MVWLWRPRRPSGWGESVGNQRTANGRYSTLSPGDPQYFSQVLLEGFTQNVRC